MRSNSIVKNLLATLVVCLFLGSTAFSADPGWVQVAPGVRSFVDSNGAAHRESVGLEGVEWEISNLEQQISDQEEAIAATADQLLTGREILQLLSVRDRLAGMRKQLAGLNKLRDDIVKNDQNDQSKRMGCHDPSAETTLYAGDYPFGHAGFGSYAQSSYSSDICTATGSVYSYSEGQDDEVWIEGPYYQNTPVHSFDLLAGSGVSTMGCTYSHATRKAAGFAGVPVVTTYEYPAGCYCPNCS